MELGFTVMLPPLYASVYELPSEPVTLQDAELLACTVSVSDCPAEIVLELAVIDTVGRLPPPEDVDETVTVVLALVLPLPFVAVAV